MCVSYIQGAGSCDHLGGSCPESNKTISLCLLCHVSSLLYIGGIKHRCPNHRLIISIMLQRDLFHYYHWILLLSLRPCTDSKMVKPLNNPLDYPVFANINEHLMTNNPIYIKTLTEKDSKSLYQISKSKIHYIRNLL